MPLKLQPGMRFGDWEVIERDYNPTSKQHSTFWFCKCNICGNIYSVSRDSLVNKKSECCNKCKGEKIRQKAEERGLATWHKGDRFGMLEVIESAGTKGNHSYVKCKCDCGNIVNVRVEHLKGTSHGRTISCGCIFFLRQNSRTVTLIHLTATRLKQQAKTLSSSKIHSRLSKKEQPSRKRQGGTLRGLQRIAG